VYVIITQTLENLAAWFVNRNIDRHFMQCLIWNKLNYFIA